MPNYEIDSDFDPLTQEHTEPLPQAINELVLPASTDSPSQILAASISDEQKTLLLQEKILTADESEMLDTIDDIASVTGHEAIKERLADTVADSLAALLSQQLSTLPKIEPEDDKTMTAQMNQVIKTIEFARVKQTLQAFNLPAVLPVDTQDHHAHLELDFSDDRRHFTNSMKSQYRLSHQSLNKSFAIRAEITFAEGHSQDFDIDEEFVFASNLKSIMFYGADTDLLQSQFAKINNAILNATNKSHEANTAVRLLNEPWFKAVYTLETFDDRDEKNVLSNYIQALEQRKVPASQAKAFEYTQQIEAIRQNLLVNKLTAKARSEQDSQDLTQQDELSLT